MLSLYFGDNEYQFPDRWEELSQDQYLNLVPLLSKFWAGEISLFDVRTTWFRKIAGLEGLKVSPNKVERVSDNIVLASRQFNFFYKLDYEGQIDSLSPGNRKLLQKTPAEEIVSWDPEIRYAENLSYRYTPDAVWAKNLIPKITVGDRVLSGWEVSVDGGALTCSLTALQFLQGNEIIAMITKDGRRRDMALLVSLLYCDPDGGKWNISDFEKLDDITLHGIILNFQAFISFIFSLTHFSILWNHENTGHKPAISISQSESLYTLSKAGYGNYEQVERMPLVTYLGIIRSDMISAIRTMHESKMKIDEISAHSKLPIDLIKKIIS